MEASIDTTRQRKKWVIEYKRDHKNAPAARAPAMR
jgi:hypothetical protein